MLQNKRKHPKEKTELHPQNKHRGRYNFDTLIKSCPELSEFVKLNPYNDLSIDFFNPKAVKTLNKALLKHYYKIEWDIPNNYLCPPVPGRADYIHHIGELLRSSNFNYSKTENPNNKIKCLDIGVGANCIYPILGIQEYGWSFVGTEIDPVAIESARKIIDSNAPLKGKLEIREQKNPKNIFFGIIQKEERFDLTLCNPPFHSSPEEAQSETHRKVSNLKQKKVSNAVLNFGGKNNELWCEGGEERFVSDMIHESKKFALSCFWFTTSVSKQSHLKGIYEVLYNVGALEVKTIAMSQGNKTSRIVAWTFLNKEQQSNWVMNYGL